MKILRDLIFTNQMKYLKKNKTAWALILFSIILYVTSMVVVKTDNYYYFYHRWFAFWLYLSSIFILLYIYLSYSITKRHFKKAFTWMDINPFIFLIIITVFINFLLLSLYPYVSISDELRDGGLFPMQIASGVLRNIFSYGAYDAQGLIIPTLTIPFYYIFGNSPLSYRVPAALLSSIDVLFLYILVRKFISKKIAFWSALILVTLPLHIFFAHTEVVVAFNFFWVPVILLVFFLLLKKHRFIDYIFLGTILGFTAGFHAAVKSFAILVFLLLLFLESKEMFAKKMKREEIIHRSLKILLLVCFIFVGFGPRLFFTSSNQFFHTSRFILESNVTSKSFPTMNELITIKNNYIQSLLVYIYEPTTFFYPVHNPVFPPFLATFFIIGIVYSFFVLKNYFVNILFFFLVALPLTNSAITDAINADQRISPLFSISSIFVGIGITYCVKLVRYKWLQYIFGGIIVFYLVWQVSLFYINQPANINRNLGNYLLMHVFYFLQTDEQYKASPATYLHDMSTGMQEGFVCLAVSPANYDYFTGKDIGAFKEQNHFLLPNATIQYMQAKSIKNNEIFIIKNKCLDRIDFQTAVHTYTISCLSGNNFTCPDNYSGNIVLHY